jgi:hypothetical protein
MRSPKTTVIRYMIVAAKLIAAVAALLAAIHALIN